MFFSGLKGHKIARSTVHYLFILEHPSFHQVKLEQPFICQLTLEQPSVLYLQGSGLSKNWAELLRRHNGERLKLERELLKEEQEAIAQFVEGEENKRKQTMNTMTDGLVSNLHGKNCKLPYSINSLTTKKQTTKYSSANFQKTLSPSCIILRIQRLESKQCRSR